MTNSELNSRLQKVRLLVCDVDGTLTDAAMYYSDRGEELKRFTTRDGMGITLLRKSGIETAIITSENSAIVTARAKKLQIQHVILGSRNKTRSIQELSAVTGIALEDMGYIGDDVNDIAPMKLVGVSAAVGDAVVAVKDVATFQCAVPGGHGAVREFAEAILVAQGKPVVVEESW